MKIDEDYTDSKKSKKEAEDMDTESDKGSSGKMTADDAEPETLGEVKAEKMKNYFKKSKVYKNYQLEQ